MNTEQLRVGDAERDEVTAALHDHFVQGRLTRDELDERLTTTLSARTAGDLRTVTRDLPAPDGRPVVPESWETGAAHRGRGAPYPPWAHGRRGPHRRPFGPLLLVALVVAAFTGWWAIFPVLACVWFAAAFTGLRHMRRHHGSLSVRR
jgi:hypothetical protein